MPKDIKLEELKTLVAKITAKKDEMAKKETS